jgi:RNA polymerase sigma factor (sigma-70 family)
VGPGAPAAGVGRLTDPGRARGGQISPVPRAVTARHREGIGQAAVMSTSRLAGPPRLQNVTLKQPFETIVAEHGATVLRVCRAVLGPADADDAWSETFLAALRAYPQLPADANVEAWLVTIAHRKAIDITRTAARRAVPVADVPAELLDDGRDLDLAAALAALPRRQREAVAYHYLAGLPYADVAAVTGGSTDAARRAAADGIARLRKTYQADGESS